jgi:hypothetical protein
LTYPPSGCGLKLRHDQDGFFSEKIEQSPLNYKVNS